jgi:hypothetical protein
MRRGRPDGCDNTSCAILAKPETSDKGLVIISSEDVSGYNICYNANAWMHQFIQKGSGWSMTVTQTSAEQHTSDEIRCSHCGSPLPAYAAFCGACGQRVDSAGQNERVPHTPAIGEDKEERYRITALVGRRSHVQLFFATDTLFKRPVTIRDIAISSVKSNKSRHV